MLIFTGSNPAGYKAEVRKDDCDKFSLFRWMDDGSGVILWREYHDLPYKDAMQTAFDWLDQKKEGVL